MHILKNGLTVDYFSFEWINYNSAFTATKFYLSFLKTSDKTKMKF